MIWPTAQEYSEAVQNPRLNFSDAELKAGQLELTPLGLPRAISGNFVTVFRMQCEQRDLAVRCFLRNVTDQQQRYTAISQHLARVKLPYTVYFEFLSEGILVQGQWYPILKMAWVTGELLDKFIEKNLYNSVILQDLAVRWVTLIETLKDAEIAHGDLQHGNILIVDNDFKLVDYDGMLVPRLFQKSCSEIGHGNYQHPHRTARDFWSDIDDFSAWVIYIALISFSIEPQLWERVGAGEDFLLLHKGDFANPDASATLALLSQHSDAYIQALATEFKQLLRSKRISQVPSLDNQIISSLNPHSANFSAAAHTSDSVKGWWVDYIKDSQPTQSPLTSIKSTSDKAELQSTSGAGFATPPATFQGNSKQIKTFGRKSQTGSRTVAEIMSNPSKGQRSIREELRPVGLFIAVFGLFIVVMISFLPPNKSPSPTESTPIERLPALPEPKIFRDNLRHGSLGPEMVWLPAGRFQMGDIQGGGDDDEQPVHWVPIERFAMGRYEVTVGEFRQFVAATGYKTVAEKKGNCWGRAGSDSGRNWRNPEFSQNDNSPVVCVSWDDATAYAVWLSQETCQQYCLPTEAQWEYAARAGTETKYWWGNEVGSNQANCWNSTCGDRFKYTAPVGSFAPNPFDLFDTVGNVWEWTCSEYENKYSGKETQCLSKESGSLRVVRGGAWDNGQKFVRVPDRNRYSQDYRNDFVGFRLVRLSSGRLVPGSYTGYINFAPKGL
ncbi:MAG TPA: hypothetical protein ENG03_01475 [Thioploca sp.]|nr:hypothetical protein [Thioploca sp.]